MAQKGVHKAYKKNEECSIMEKIKSIEGKYLKKKTPEFNIGDTVLVHVKVKEEDIIR